MLARYIDQCWILVFAMRLLVVLSLGLYLLGYKDAGVLTSMLGTWIIMLVGIPVYIVFFDPKKRWPGLTAFERWTRFITFQR